MFLRVAESACLGLILSFDIAGRFVLWGPISGKPVSAELLLSLLLLAYRGLVAPIMVSRRPWQYLILPW
jgi:hypothetical protein